MANIRNHLVINTDRQKVYEAITSQKGLRGWWTTNTDAKAELGYHNEFRFGPEYFKKMKVLTLDVPSLVEWECVEGDKEWIGTKIRFELLERDGGTFLKFAHVNWREESEYFGLCSHHWSRYLDSLKSLVETGKGAPYSG